MISDAIRDAFLNFIRDRDLHSGGGKINDGLFELDAERCLDIIRAEIEDEKEECF